MADNAEGIKLSQLPHVKETVLKKRKNNNQWAINKRSRLEHRRLQRINEAKNRIKTPDEFVQKFRQKELDMVRMKTRVKVRRPQSIVPESELLFVIRLPNTNAMHPNSRKILNRLRLRNIFHGVFLRANKSILDMLVRVEPYVTYGCPNLNSISNLVSKKSCGMISNISTPLTNNTVVEEALGKYGIICLDDIVHQIATVGPHFNEVAKFLMPFKLTKPVEKKVLTQKRILFKDGGDVGNRQNLINELIGKMNK
ncbi:60S ribosomal protein L7-like protein [Zostera marina]|uniref:60S ribosomal protein L7-like protein n=1 Tax=Zostera marina TaxID=29655 RepID=A0A0K9PFC2_ZOSMR|nr:60S ribosomal protein L7-like protein [Zostera marina]